MGTGANAGWRITFADIGEKKQHQQGSSLRKHVDAPVQIIIGIAGIRRKTAIHVPARVSWIVRRRKSNRERPEIASRLPSAWTTKLIKCLVQDWRIGGPGERLLSIHTKAEPRFDHGCSLDLIGARVAANAGPVLGGNCTPSNP